MTATARLPRRLALVAVTGVACVSVLAACHGKSASSGGGSASAGGSGSAASKPSGGAGSSGGASGSDMVEVKDFSFNPKNLSVSTGTTVTWKFEDSAKHNVDIRNGKIKSKDLSSGATYKYKFNTAGTYDYICSIHQYMHGSVVVK